MKGVKSAAEFFQAPPPGRYLSKIVSAESGYSKSSGNSMITLGLTILEPKEYAGISATDWLVTDCTARGHAKKKLRQLGVLDQPQFNTDAEIPDEQIAAGLLGLQILVDFGNEPMMSESEKGSGRYDKERTEIDERTGQLVTIQKLVVKGYARHAVGGAQHQPAQSIAAAPNLTPGLQQPITQYTQPSAPAGFGLPQIPQYGQPGQVPQQLPQQGYGQLPQQQIPQYGQPGQIPAQSAPVQHGGSPVGVVGADLPTQWAQPAQGQSAVPLQHAGVPQGYGALPPQFGAQVGPNGGAPAPWAQPGQDQAELAAEAAGGGKRTRARAK